MSAKKPQPVPDESDWSKHNGPRPTSPPPPRKKTPQQYGAEIYQLKRQLNEALNALMWMVEKHMQSKLIPKTQLGKPYFDHGYTEGGINACEILDKHGRIDGTQYDWEHCDD